MTQNYSNQLTGYSEIMSDSVSQWANLNHKTVSPSLALYKNRYLICMPNQKNKDNEERYYEYTDLRAEPKWEKKIFTLILLERK